MSMQVRVCPKCGAENGRSYVKCGKCYTSLLNAPLTDGNGGGSTAQQPSQTPVSVGAPSQGTANETPRPNPYGSAGAERPTYPMRDREKPDRVGAAFLAVMVAIVLGGLGYGAWWFYAYFTRPLTPAEVVQRLSDPIVTGSYEKLKPYLSRGTIEALIKQNGSEKAAAEKINSKIMGIGGYNPFAKNIETGKTTYEGKNVALVEILVPLREEQRMHELLGNDFKLQMICVREDNKWKLDIVQFGARLEARLEKAMEKKYGKMPWFSHGAFSQPRGGAVPPPQGTTFPPPPPMPGR